VAPCHRSFQLGPEGSGSKVQRVFGDAKFNHHVSTIN
jgi:hypothetical protein